MACAKETIRYQLGMGAMLIEQFTKDLTDAEYFKAAVPGANHAGWIVGHLAVSADSMVAQATGGQRRFDDQKHALFDGKSECKADANAYPPRKDIDEMFKNASADTIEALTTFDESKWDNPSPESMPSEFFPTVGSVWGIIATHPFWHAGQLTTNRVALGKPRVLGGA
jgi:hypothetical protein